MRKWNRTKIGVIAVVASAVVLPALAAGLWSNFPVVGQPSYCSSTNQPGGPGTPTQCTNTVPAGPPVLTGLEQIPADTHTTGGGAQTVTIPVSLLANLSGTPRNYLDNGSMAIQQRGAASAVSCGTTSASSAYGADRWTCITNVTSGAGQQQPSTTAALLPAGFANVTKLWRNSGSLAQPVCSIQEISSQRSTALAGKQVSLSAYVEALAGLAADNGNIVNGYVVYGTGNDQGLGTFTASPAITPAWTNVATLGGANVGVTTLPVRYNLATVTIPSTATEVGIELCFTPTTTGSGGATDGIAFTGVQLEVAASPSAFEFQTPAIEFVTAQRYYWQWAETVSSTADSPFMCAAQSTTVAVCKAVMHQPFRVAPTTACTAGTLKRQVAGTDTTVSACAAAATTNGINGVDNVTITATVASGDTAGLAGTLMSGNSTGGGLITATADF